MHAKFITVKSILGQSDKTDVCSVVVIHATMHATQFIYNLTPMSMSVQSIDKQNVSLCYFAVQGKCERITDLLLKIYKANNVYDL